jgi:hypothetical protein
MKSQNAKIGMLLLLAVGGCAQIIGLSDYDIDPALGDAGEGGQAQGEGGSDTSGSSGKTGGGDAGVGQGGEPVVQGGMPAVGGTGAGGEGGSGEEIPVIVIPCDSVECCTSAGGIADDRELLQNVDFEAGQEWWDEASTGSYDVIVNENDIDSINAHAGEWFVWLGGAVDEIGSLTSPTITVPADTGWVTISGYRYLVFDSTTTIYDPETMVGDFASISLFQGEDIFEPIFYWDNYEFDNSSWFYFELGGPADNYAGLSFEYTVLASTDNTSDDPTAQAASNFFFDDLSFIASRCIEPPQ